MEFIKRLFKTNKKPSDSWTMFSTSKSEVKELLVSTGQLTIGDDFLKIENYPFEPSIAFRQNIFKTNQIDDIDFKSYPPTFRVGNEIIFLTSEKKVELEEFATKNNIKTVERSWIWDWILEPFLDTEYTTETDQRLTKLLGSYGLTNNQVKSLRAEVETQMLKYNFDTMLWEWGGFNALDVLRAIRTKYKKDEYEDFYRRVMEIALLTKKTDE
ncbi:hypothetical protein CO230_04145 [Chryseobacterium sp. 6424]|uniref:hypothetical protein n=1 Tax=Chryseobacterium sp. 6424 TaxID=2039166 RepID=UPI000EFB9DEF|nr:hypothetical protein [Chryseobacterium sp. 6424]AYO57384.1 hypothetical protein CO230_04145 [Chryseobacterium sp. 6424]